MKTSLFSLAAAVLLASTVHAAGVVPPATSFKSSLTFPNPPSGTDWKITKSSSVQVQVGTHIVTVKLKLGGVVDTTLANTPVSQTLNTFQVDLRYGGAVKTVQFTFTLSGGKTVPSTIKTTFDDSVGLPPPGVVAGDSIEVVRVKCLQGGGGGGAGQNFCVAGLTAK
jgi:hypothetical protein